MTARTVLLTGATGFLGKVALAELVRRQDDLGLAEIGVLIRARASHTAAERFQHEVAGSPCFSRMPADWAARVRVLEGNLSEQGVGLDDADRAWAEERVTHVLHAAASIDFDLPIRDATRSNVETTLNLLEAAQRWPALQRLIYVSTAYVTPNPGHDVPVQEALAPLPRPAAQLYQEILQRSGEKGFERSVLRASGHPNTYTLTKSITEHLLMERRGKVPVSILRPSIISASWARPFPGWIDSTAGFGAFVVLIGLGHLRVVVGRPRTRLDLVPVDTVADAMLRAVETPAAAPPEVRHVVAGLDRSLRVGECWAGIVKFFRLHRIARRPTFAFLGPRGIRYFFAHVLHHDIFVWLSHLQAGRGRRSGRRLHTRLTHINRVFPYFTSKSFAFETGATFPADFAPDRYVDVVCRGVHQHVLRRDEAQWELGGRHHPGHGQGGDFKWAMTQPHGNAWVRFACWVVSKILRRSMERVTVDMPSFETAVRAAPPGSSLILVPNHRSYFDFVLCSYLCFARPDLGIPIPYIAATLEFGKLPLLGRILSALHAFYLRRGLGREDPELTRRIHTFLDEGKSLEFFIEGQRSRSREFLPPKRGLLRALQSSGRTCTLLPVAFSYDRLAEEKAFATELSGAPKPRMKVSVLLRWAWAAWRGRIHLGRTHIACGTPIILEPQSDVYQVGEAVIEELRDATVATTYHLEGYLQKHPIDGVDAAWLKSAIEERGGRVYASELHPSPKLDPLIARTFKEQFAHHFRTDGSPDIRAQRVHRSLFPPDGTEASGAGSSPAPSLSAPAARIRESVR